MSSESEATVSAVTPPTPAPNLQSLHFFRMDLYSIDMEMVQCYGSFQIMILLLVILADFSGVWLVGLLSIQLRKQTKQGNWCHAKIWGCVMHKSWTFLDSYLLHVFNPWIHYSRAAEGIYFVSCWFVCIAVSEAIKLVVVGNIHMDNRVFEVQ